MNEINPLEPILVYKMNERETKAYKLCLIWQTIVQKELPEYKNPGKLPKKGDPRKCLLFKHAYKLVSEKDGLIADKDFRWYVTAQIQVLKSVRNGDIHALIGPHCLTGEKAWVRWQMWKNKFNKKVASQPQTTRTETGGASFLKVKTAIDDTRTFLFGKFGGQPSYKQIEQSVEEKLMIRWITLNRVCPYYAILSPWLKKALGGKTVEQVFVFDLGVYKSSITEEVRLYFDKVFNYEKEV